MEVREERGPADRLVEHLRPLVPDRDEGEDGDRPSVTPATAAMTAALSRRPKGEFQVFHSRVVRKTGPCRPPPGPSVSRAAASEHDPNASGAAGARPGGAPAAYSESSSFRAAASSFFLASSTAG